MVPSCSLENEKTKRAERLMQGAALLASGVAVLLVVIKGVAWWLSDSVAILSSLMDSALDLMASVVTVYAVRHAIRPPDADHRFGHGKAEALAALTQSFLVSLSALFLAVEAVPRFITPQIVTHEVLGIAIMVFSIVVTGILITVQHWVIQQTGSVAISADRMHYAGDLLINAGVGLSLFVTSIGSGWAWADPLCALIVAAILVFSVVRIASKALDCLMDKELPDAERARILDLAAHHPHVIDAHDLRTRTSGIRTFILLHLTLPREMTLATAHHVCDSVAGSIRQEFPGSEVTIHQDPEGLVEERLDAQIDNQDYGKEK